MVVFSVKFDKFGLKVSADTGETFPQVFKDGFFKDFTVIFCLKDQVSMKDRSTASSACLCVNGLWKRELIERTLGYSCRRFLK